MLSKIDTAIDAEKKPHQEQLRTIMTYLAAHGEPHPGKWICEKLEISAKTLECWLAGSDKSWARRPESYAIKYLLVILPDIQNKLRRFTAKEDEYLLENYRGRGKLRRCADALSRPLVSVSHRAKLLGLTPFVDAKADWLPEDDNYLIANYPSGDLDVIAEHLGRTLDTLRWRAGVLKIKRTKLNKSKDATYIKDYHRRYDAERRRKTIEAQVAPEITNTP